MTTSTPTSTPVTPSSIGFAHRPSLASLIGQQRRIFLSFGALFAVLALVAIIEYVVLSLVKGRAFYLYGFPLSFAWIFACLVIALVSALRGAMATTPLLALSGAGLTYQYLSAWIADLISMLVGLAIWSVLVTIDRAHPLLAFTDNGMTLTFGPTEGWQPPTVSTMALVTLAWLFFLVIGRFIGHATRMWRAPGGVAAFIMVAVMTIVAITGLFDYAALSQPTRFLLFGVVPLILLWPTTALALHGPIRYVG